VHIIVDGAEKLAAWGEPVLDRLPDLLRSFAVSAVALTSEPFPLYRGCQGGGEGQPFRVVFGRLSETQTRQALTAERPPSVPRGAYARYVQTLVSVFRGACEDLDELRYLARLFFARAFPPPPLPPVPLSGLRALFRGHRERLFRHDDSAAGSAALGQGLGEPTNATFLGARSELDANAPGPTLDAELPLLAKFVLMAAYACSYNPAEMDRDYFTPGERGEKRRKRRVVRDHGASGNQKRGSRRSDGTIRAVPHRLFGPSNFDLERLLAVLNCLVMTHAERGGRRDGRGGNNQPAGRAAKRSGGVRDRYYQTQAPLAHVSSLVELRLLKRVSAADDWARPRFKCTVVFDEVKRIAESVNFNLQAFLYDET
jgi:hypothetical protein